MSSTPPQVGAQPPTVTLTNPAGVEEQVQSDTQLHILPTITNLDPTSGAVGTQVGIVGGGFVGATKVTFGGVKATSFTVVDPTLIQADVPAGAKTGKIVVTTPNGKPAKRRSPSTERGAMTIADVAASLDLPVGNLQHVF